MSYKRGNWLYLLILVVVVFLPVLLGWVGYSWMEARAYERVTGKHVTLEDAMFLDLRVQESTK